MQEPQKLDENAIESLLLQHLENAGYDYKSGKELERKSEEWILEGAFKEAVRRINFADSKPCNLNLSYKIQEQLISEALARLKALENEELLEANAKCHAYLTQGIPLEQQSAPFEYNERDKALRDVLVHLYEWQILLLRFVRTNLEKTSDFVPFLPAPYNFKTYPAMNREIWQKHQSTPLENAKAMLEKSHTQCMELIETLPPKELFVKKHYKWCGNTSLGSYCVSATSSHYDWASKCIKKRVRSLKKV